ncbi:MAG: entericidin EcnAB [Micavibrio sp.]|nr:entericidin EcnAB [Micavibrio sp.]|tara:strand:- start:839 stop:979 length:141 start_codon:yes stop_codon:yes gene_type:complete
MSVSKNKLLTLSALALACISLSACNTIEGAGRDIEHAGETVQDAAE